jgi:hypothetical protein
VKASVGGVILGVDGLVRWIECGGDGDVGIGLFELRWVMTERLEVLAELCTGVRQGSDGARDGDVVGNDRADAGRCTDDLFAGRDRSGHA